MDNWLVIRLKPRQAHRVGENLTKQNAEFYYPLVYELKPRAGWVACPMFPGYGFARPRGSGWVFVKSTFGVSDVLMSTGEKPAVIPDAFVVGLRAREDARGVIRLSGSQFDRGERVHVELGPLRDLEAVVDGVSARDRIYVLLDMFGRAVRTEIDVGSVSRG